MGASLSPLVHSLAPLGSSRANLKLPFPLNGCPATVRRPQYSIEAMGSPAPAALAPEVVEVRAARDIASNFQGSFMTLWFVQDDPIRFPG
jgi:hypothetical protein